MARQSFEIRNYSFTQMAINQLASEDHLEENWPVVYQIYNNREVYIGETTNLKNRMNQHLANTEKSSLRRGSVKVVFDETFNKSAALDLESYLIQYFSGDGKFKVLNRNDGMCDRDYYNRANYRRTFEEIWNRLRELKIADKTISEINNSELFKFSPYKNLNFEQLNVVTEIVQNIDEAICDDRKSLSIIDGDAGTGKTIIIMYLAKLLADLQTFDNQNDDIDDESNFNIFFELEHINQNFKDKSIALVVPQPSLCGRIRKIFDKIDLGNANIRIFSPIQFGKCDDNFDITLVDEAHLLKVGVTGTLGKQVHEIDQKIFGDNKIHSELDWIMAKSKNVVFVFSEQQRIRPTNIDKNDISQYTEKFDKREYYLKTQMRSLGGKKYIDYIHDILSNGFRPKEKETFKGFEAKIFNNIQDFVAAMEKREAEYGLSRMVAGFDWKWNSKKNKSAYDIEINGMKFRWNSTQNNWIGSKNAPKEVGSIYTVQGDDLNYVGIIFGNDLIYRNEKIIFNRKSCADSGAMKRSQRQVANGEQISENDMLEQVLRTYRILMNRAVKGVYIYACDDDLREYLSNYFDIA
ncbi:DUF2075 domain-containing protein [Candidatus Saccharibacteria bacterium]|nr:DUF2075 domain-containing protein [Candidatus Saccharibacteria bacterium]